MGGAYCMHGEKINTYAVFLNNPKEIGHLENPSVDERITLQWIFNVWWRKTDLINLYQDRTIGGNL
jgi:hypothetical protein